MSMIERYREMAGSAFLGVKNCPEDSTLIITSMELDEETYANPGLIVTGTFSGDNEERKVRLSVKNVNSIAATLGDDDTKWIGKTIQCVAHMDYGKGMKGLIWRGGVLGQGAPVATISDIVKQIMVATKKKAPAIKKLIDKEVEDGGGIIDEISAAQIVADALDVELK